MALLATHAAFAAAFGAPLDDPAPAVPRVGTEPTLLRVASQPQKPDLVLYATKVNRQDFGVIPILRLEDGTLFVRETELKGWRLRAPSATPLTHEGERYFPLNALPGASVMEDRARQALEIEFAANAFESNLIGFGSSAPPVPEPPGWGAFANYDFLATRTKSAETDRTSRVDGLLEFGVFGPHGTFVTDALARNVAGTASAGDASESRRHLIRLETTWTLDLPSQVMSVQLGDTIGKSGIWGRPVRFGGLRYGTNFATTPGFVTLPLPALGGEAALPSTTELYIDGVLRQRGTLPPGPFELSNLPAVTGQGQAQLVVRDVLGREQIITQSYYASSLLLKEGLRDDSFELGFVRENFVLRSNDYGDFFAAATLRKGQSERLTTELRAEVLRSQQTAGVGASVIASEPLPLVASAAGALSRSESGSGGLVFLGLERLTGRVSFGIRSQWQSSMFTQLGLQPERAAPRQQSSANLGFLLGSRSSLGMSYVRRRSRDEADLSIAAANLSFRLGKTTSLLFFATATSGADRSRFFGITLVSALDDRTSAFASRTRQGEANEALIQIQQSVPPGSGFGYRALAGSGAAGERKEVGVALQTDRGTYSLEAGDTQAATTYRLGASGGIALVGGRTALSRRIDDAFAMVEVPDYADVGIYVNNQLVARTDSRGVAFIPRLLPYQNNPVRVDPNELPLDSQIDATQLQAVPYFRSGLALKFPVKRTSGALVVLALDDGAPMPVGAVVKLAGQTEEFLVAQRGEVYVTGLGTTNRLQATWNGQTCSVSLELPDRAELLPRVGPLTCGGVQR